MTKPEPEPIRTGTRNETSLRSKSLVLQPLANQLRVFYIWACFSSPEQPSGAIAQFLVVDFGNFGSVAENRLRMKRLRTKAGSRGGVTHPSV